MRTNNNFIAGGLNDSYVQKLGSLTYVFSRKMIISFGFLLIARTTLRIWGEMENDD